MSDMSIAQACTILGVPARATAQDLRRARRALVRANHPDLLARHERAKADRALSDINAAFDTLIQHASTRSPERATEDFAPTHRAAPRPPFERRQSAEPSDPPARTQEPVRPAPHAATPAPPEPDHPAPSLPATRRTTTTGTAQRIARQAFDTTFRAIAHPRPAPTRTEYA